jgi:hypothetical protein
MTKNTTIKTKAKQQKAVSRAVKQAGFKNIKEAKEALRKVKKAKITPSSCCKKEECCIDDISDMLRKSDSQYAELLMRLLKLERAQNNTEAEAACTSPTNCINSACSEGDISCSASKNDWSIDNILAYRSWSPEDNSYYLNIKIKL